MVFIGGNDVFKLTSLWKWEKQLKHCLFLLQTKSRDPLIFFFSCSTSWAFPCRPKSLETGVRFLEISSAIKPEPGYPFEFGSSFARWRLSPHQGVFPGRRYSSCSIGLPSLGWNPGQKIHQTSGKKESVIDLETDLFSNNTLHLQHAVVHSLW